MAGDRGQDQAPAPVKEETVESLDEITPQEENSIGGEKYVRDKLARRARMASAAFIVAIGSGVALIAVGVLKPGAAERIDHMGTFLGVFYGALFSFVAAYMGLGTYELRNNLVGQTSPYGLGNRGGLWGGSGVRSAHRITNRVGTSPQGTGSTGLGLDDENG